MTTLTEPGRDELAQDTADCEAIWEFLGIEAPCGLPAVGRFRRVCVHEHARDGWLCRDHAETPRNGLCLTCYELPGGLSHECPISMTELPAVTL